MEEWKDIEGYEGLYQVSSFGRVKSLRNELILKPCISRGYYQVNLCKNKIKQKYSVSRLIGNTFISNPENKSEIDHIDRNPKNNSISNLRWVSRHENCLNRITKNKFGIKGVVKHGNGYKTSITIDGNNVHLGTFSTPEEASEMFEAVWAGLNSCL